MDKYKNYLVLIILFLIFNLFIPQPFFSDAFSVFRMVRAISHQLQFNRQSLKEEAQSLIFGGIDDARDNLSLLSTWRHNFQKYKGEKNQLTVTFGRGKGESDVSTLALPKYLSLETQARFVALEIANELMTNGAGSVDIKGPLELKNRVRELFDPYFDAGTGERKNRIVLEIIGNDSSITSVSVALPEALKNFNYSALTVPKQAVADFADDISNAIKNLSSDSVEKITVKSDYHTFKKLKGILKENNKELANKLLRYEFYDSVAGYIMERYNSYFAESERGKHLFDLSADDLQTAIRRQDLPAGFNFNRNKGTYLGLDIGASSIKIVLLKDGKALIEASTEKTWRSVDDDVELFNGVITGVIKPFVEAVLDGEDNFHPFADSGISWEIKYDQQNTAGKNDIKLEDIEGIGVSWAGGIIDNKIIASSKALDNVIEYKKEGVMGVGRFADLLSSAFSNKPVELKNDGDSGAFAFVGEKKDVIGIVLGSSIAGGYIDANGNIAPFVGELGKLIVDTSSTFIKAGRELPESSVYVAIGGLKNLIKKAEIEAQIISTVNTDPDLLLLGDVHPIQSFKELNNSQIGRALRKLIEQGDEVAKRIEEVVGVYLAEVIVEAQHHYAAKEVVIAGGILKSVPGVGEYVHQRLDELNRIGVTALRGEDVAFVTEDSDIDSRYAGAYGAADWINFKTQLQQHRIVQYKNIYKQAAAEKKFSLQKLADRIGIDVDKVRNDLLWLIENREIAEFLEIVDENGALSGVAKRRDLIHQDGDWHLEVDAIIVDKNGNILLQQRGADATNPGTWTTSVSGHLLVGDMNYASGLVRESLEEIGLNINAGNLTLIGSYKKIGNPDVPGDSYKGTDFYYHTSQYNRQISGLYFYVITEQEQAEIEDFINQAGSAEVAQIEFKSIAEIIKGLKENSSNYNSSLRHYFGNEKILEQIEKLLNL